MIFCAGALSERAITGLVASLYNPLIERLLVKRAAAYRRGGMGVNVPRVVLGDRMSVGEVDLELDDAGLEELSRRGIEGRGPLALDLPSMKVIRDYYRRALKRKPSDVELESLAQTWSEHCKHTIFAA